nr:serine/threonine-protein kinase [Micromonospora sp. DSM 115978]
RRNSVDDNRPGPDPTWDAVLAPLSPQDPREVGGYLLRARIGEGGMGAVYLSFTPGGRPVALKVARPELSSDPEFRRRFAAEVAIAQRVQGLYTAPVVDSDATAPRPWLATAYVAAPSLAAAVGRQGAPLPPETVLLLVAGVAEALQVIHAAGIIHRDLKPANVILAGDGPRVIDFGISRAVDSSSSALTSTGVRVGTPAFMAPEQVQGKSLSPAADVFSLGSTAYYAATGQLPFGADAGVFYRVEHHEPDWDRCPDQVRDVLKACMAKDPAGRPTPAALIELCRDASTDDRLRIGEGWLPATVVTELTRYDLSNLASLPPAVTTTRSPANGAAPIPARRPSAAVLAGTIALVVIVLLAVGLAILLDGDGDPPVVPPSASATLTGTTSPTSPTSPTTEPSSETSTTPTASATASSSPEATNREPGIWSQGRVTLTDDNDTTRSYDVDAGRRTSLGGPSGDFRIDYNGWSFTGHSGALARTAVANWETCSTVSGFGVELLAADLPPGTLLCGNSGDGRTVAIVVEGVTPRPDGGVESVTFSYTTWALPND